MAVIQLSIPGKPIAKARPRFARRGKFTTTYSAQATEEGLWIMSARQQLHGAPLMYGPVDIEFNFYIPRPKSHYGAKGLKPSAPIMPTGKPDLSNYIKFAEDCLNECGVWSDDSVIVNIVARKTYGDYPITDIVITETK